MNKLLAIQTELKAPKNQRNNFGNYNYRSCEDILEAVKPLLKKYECQLTLSDELVIVGERYYIKATVSFTDGEKETISTAYAREAETKKGMDDSQITGTASSYARKYALNGLFLIDDTKDADTNEHTKQVQQTSGYNRSGIVTETPAPMSSLTTPHKTFSKGLNFDTIKANVSRTNSIEALENYWKDLSLTEAQAKALSSTFAKRKKELGGE